MLIDGLFLLAAGFAGGVVNSVAGGGSFITFPALIFAGVPPVSANATNTFASCAGYLSGTYAFRKDIGQYWHELPRFIAVSVAGGIIGAWLLLSIPENLFQEAIPWLLLLATFLFVFGGPLNRLLRQFTKPRYLPSSLGVVLLALLLLAVSVYGGFFNAGLGIVILSYLALAGYTDINVMNGLKLLVSSAVSLVAIIVFIADGAIAWYEGSLVLAGSLLGGFIAAKYSRLLPQRYVRYFVIIASVGMTGYFFYNTG